MPTVANPPTPRARAWDPRLSPRTSRAKPAAALSESPSGSSKRPSHIGLMVSLAINVVLGVALVAPPHRSTPTFSPVEAASTVPPPSSPTHARPTATRQGQPASLQSPWEGLASTSLAQYAANLRAAGCPDATIRDILFAELDRQYAALTREGNEPPSPPSDPRHPEADDPARAAARAAWETEAARLTLASVGHAWTPRDRAARDEFKDLEIQALARFLVGPMPEDTFREVAAILTYYSHGEARRHSRDDDDAGTGSRLRQALQSELAATLTPTQFDELLARLDAVELFSPREPKFAGLDVTPDEVRSIHLARASTTKDPLAELLGLPEPEEGPAAELLRQQYEAQLEIILGSERFQAFRQAQHPTPAHP